MESNTDQRLHIYRAVNADGDPVEVCISGDIQVVASHEYLDAEKVRERFGVEGE